MTNYEPMPSFGCVHSWVDTGPPFKSWASGGTGGEAPEDAPITQKRICLHCGGVEWHQIET